MNQGNKILGAPIIIQMDGTFLTPTATGEYVKGHITPDLRLEHLDAFLEQLGPVVSNNPSLGATIAKTVKDVSDKMQTFHKEVQIELRISVSIDPQRNNMEYAFDIAAKAIAG